MASFQAICKKYGLANPTHSLHMKAICHPELVAAVNIIAARVAGGTVTDALVDILETSPAVKAILLQIKR
jgi:hypothetical protein